MDGRVPQIQEKIVEVIKVILREQCQRVLFFSFDSVWEQPTPTRESWRILTACGKGAVGCTRRACCPTAHPHTRGLIPSASDGIRNMVFSTHSHTSHLLHCCFHSLLRLGNCLLCHGSGDVFVVPLVLDSLTMCAAVSEEAASDILVGAQPRIRCWARARSSSSELVNTATARRQQRVEDATRVGLQFPFRSERRGPRSTQRRHEVA